MNHNMLLHLIIIHFQHPRTIIHNRHIWWLCQNNNIYIYPPHSPPTTFLIRSSLSFLFFFLCCCPNCSSLPFHLWTGKQEKKNNPKKKRLKAAGAKGSGALRGERMDRWTDKCVWVLSLWVNAEERISDSVITGNNSVGFKTQRAENSERWHTRSGGVCVRVCTRVCVCVRPCHLEYPRYKRVFGFFFLTYT